MTYHTIKKCRICGNENLELILDLGEQTLSGIFPDKPELEHKSPLKLVKCSETHSAGGSSCGHVQMESTFSPEIMYGDDYGYRSGLNKWMVNHLFSRVALVESMFKDNPGVSLNSGDIVVDIAGNDGTTLGFYPKDLKKYNVDPTANKFAKYQPEEVNVISDFFSESVLKEKFDSPDDRAKIITAFSVFYDLEDPVQFLKDIKACLDKDGLLVLEQSYMPLMFKQMSYDTCCHEHLSYFALRQILFMFEIVGFKLVDLSFNMANGGSFVVTATHTESKVWKENIGQIEKQKIYETDGEFDSLDTWKKWEEDIKKTKTDLLNTIKGKRVAALGASTKGNVLLQYCGLDSEDILVVGDVNPDKHGCFTPGTWIPITDEDTVLAGDYDYLLVLPWHFKDFFVNNEKFKGKTLLFPLPYVHTVTVK